MKTKNQKTLPAHGKLEALVQRDPAYDEIALAAYYIWEDRGRPMTMVWRTGWRPRRGFKVRRFSSRSSFDSSRQYPLCISQSATSAVTAMH